jgi:hypothetical protein
MNPTQLQNIPQNASGGGFRNINGSNWKLMPRSYVFAIPHVGGANDTATTIIMIDQGIPFLASAVSVYDTADETIDPGNTQIVYPNFVTIVDQRNNYAWSNIPEPRQCLGTKEHPKKFTDEIYIEGGTQIAVTTMEPAASAVAGTTYVSITGFALQSIG